MEGWEREKYEEVENRSLGERKMDGRKKRELRRVEEEGTNEGVRGRKGEEDERMEGKM